MEQRSQLIIPDKMRDFVQKLPGDLEFKYDMLRKELEEERNQNWNSLTEAQKDEAIRRA